jgi:acyl-CoA synthetase (AMP-forming)/AMP-acid ligase II
MTTARRPTLSPPIRQSDSDPQPLEPTPTVFAAFSGSARNWHERPFLHVTPETAQRYAISPAAITYGNAATEVATLRQRYQTAGYGTGYRIGLMLENRPAAFLHWFALNSLGASVVPLNADLRSAELAYLLDHSRMCLAVTTPAHLDKLREAANACAVVTDDASLPPAPSPARQEVPGSATECALLYTSGTTGKPKGCVLSNDYFLRCGRWYTQIGGLCTLRPGHDRLITPLPMTHMNAMACSTLGMVMTGGCIIPLDRFHPRTWWQTVRNTEATIVHSLGVMPTMLLGFDPSPDDRAHNVRFGFAPGVDPRYHAAFEGRFGIPMIDAWAMTETGAGAAVIASEEPRLVGRSCFGRAQPFMQLRIVDESGTDVAEDTPGELLVRSSDPDPHTGFFSEYLNDPQATAAAWEGGWFHTGDVVRRDSGGNLYFVDRRKNVIRRSGENIAAAEVESVLRQHDLVQDVACAAVPDELRGEEVLACIVPREPIVDLSAAATEVVTHALRELAYFKAPGYVTFVEALPLTATNKVQRGELKAWARDLVGKSNCIDTRHLKRHT